MVDKTDRLYISDIESCSPELFKDDDNVRNIIKEFRKTGNEKLQAELVHNYGRYVVSIAKNYQDQGLPLSDLISEGMVGLLNAIEKFDVDNVTKFVTYSNTVVSRQIREALDEFNYPTKVPKNIRNEINKMKSLRHNMDMDGKDIHEVIDVVDKETSNEYTRNRCVDYVVNPGLYRSVSTQTSESEDSIFEVAMCADISDPDAGLVMSDLSNDLQRIFSAMLTDSEISVITLYFGLNRKFPVSSTEEIGRRLGLTGERARQLRESGLQKLNQPKSRKILQKYLG